MYPTPVGKPDTGKPERGDARVPAIRQATPSRAPSVTNLASAQASLLDGSLSTRNVSFASDLNGLTAKYEHNPPAVMRRVEAARKEQSPLTDTRSATPSRSNSRTASHAASPQSTPPLAPVFTNPFSSASITSLHMPPSVLQSTEALSLASQDEVHILVAVTGSVATIKLPQIVHKLKQIYRRRAAIQIVVTKAATHFFDPQDIPRDVKVWYDSDEWRSRIPYRQGEGVQYMDHQLHIRLRRWADILLIAPCSANTLAKLTHGICDNLLTSTFRVWNPEVPVLLAPAMNTHMYTNPVTKRHFDILKQYFPYVQILKPVEKVLVCGDIGMGGMCEWTEIVQVLVKKLGAPLEDESDSSDDDEGPAK